MLSFLFSKNSMVIGKRMSLSNLTLVLYGHIICLKSRVVSVILLTVILCPFLTRFSLHFHKCKITASETTLAKQSKNQIVPRSLKKCPKIKPSHFLTDIPKLHPKTAQFLFAKMVSHWYILMIQLRIKGWRKNKKIKHSLLTWLLQFEEESRDENI